MNLRLIFLCIILHLNSLYSSVLCPQDLFVTTADHAAEIAVKIAEEAHSFNTFAVGGLLVDNNTKKVLATARNAVLKNGYLCDSTAHVERQLISWYIEQINKGVTLPKPSDLTIVSSLDPCVMCAGCILQSGFHVYSVALDEPTGVTDGKGFLTIPQTLRQKACTYFHTFGSENDTGIFSQEKISVALSERSINILLQSLNSIRTCIYTPNNIASNNVLEIVGTNPEFLSDDHILKIILRRFDSSSLRYKWNNDYVNHFLEGRHISNIFWLVDQHDNILLTVEDDFNRSPLSTGLMTLVQIYAKVQALIAEKTLNTLIFLPHIKNLRLFSLFGPSEDAITIINLGVFGSAMEGLVDRPDHWTYLKSACDNVEEILNGLPSFYREVVGINPKLFIKNANTPVFATE